MGYVGLIAPCVRRCRYPSYLAHSLAADLFESQRTVPMRPAGANYWEVIPPRESSAVFGGDLNVFWGAVSRNIDRDCHRRLVAGLTQG